MPNGKGTYFAALRAFVRERFGDEGLERYLSVLEKEDRDTVATAVSIDWVDMGIRLRATRELEMTFGKGDDSLLSEFGRFEAQRDLSTTQRVFLRLANPGYAIQKAGQYWRRFYDWGELSVERQSKTQVVATLKNSVVADAHYCTQFMAYLTRVFELVGAKDVVVKHTKCRARGHSNCVYDGSWRG